MDVKDSRTEGALSDRSDGSKYTQGGAVALQCNRNKSYQDIGSNPLAKAESARPCAVIGPDRVVPPATSEPLLKKGAAEPWPGAEHAYRRPPEYPHRLSNANITRNISPRQTFQENMQRINVPPAFNAVRHSDSANFNHVQDRHVPLTKNAKPNVAPEPKYCDVPYTVNILANEPKNAREPDMYMSSVNPALTRTTPHMWPPPGSVNVPSARSYSANEPYQYPQYPNCMSQRPPVIPVPRTHRVIQEDPAYVYPEHYYQEVGGRFKAYPHMKERYPQPRYDYTNPYHGQFHLAPPQTLKYDIPKPTQAHPYPVYPHLKYLDNRVPDPSVEGYQRQVAHPPHHNLPYHNQILRSPYTQVPASNPQKAHQFPQDGSVKPVPSNKLHYDQNSKMYVEYENARNKAYPMAEHYFVNEMNNRIHPMKNPIVMPNYSAVGMHAIPPQQYYVKDNPQIKTFEYMQHFRNFEPHLSANSVLRHAPQFSPNTLAISPADSIASNETPQTHATSHEDCGYVSQSSSASIRSVDSGVYRLPHDYYKRPDIKYSPTVGSSPMAVPKPEGHLKSSSKEKQIDVRQFLSMWNEGEEENSECNNSKEIIIQTGSSESSNLGIQKENNQDQLYVLGLVNVSNEDLSKYEHIETISKLPENIKGYNNLELYSKFEEAMESCNVTIPKDYPVLSKDQKIKQLVEPLPRPVSPLDVEAKISQSVIHKEVGCNFEIRPCTPKMLNVEVAAPAQVLGERIIEKVTNPLSHIVKSPLPSKTGDILNCSTVRKQDNSFAISDNPSCKMTSSPYSSNNLEPVKSNYAMDLEINSGVCLASLPRLDNDIEFNFPEVNQQFINANKKDSAATINISNNPDSNANDDKIISDSETTHIPQFDDKAINKLSKYRKSKTNHKDNSGAKEEANVRTDSVIIKNPENIRNIEDKLLENQLNLQSSSSSPMNLTSQNNCTSLDVQVKNKDNETALDFSLNKSAIDTNKNIKAQADLYLPCDIGIQEIDLCDVNYLSNEVRNEAVNPQAVTDLEHDEISANLEKLFGENVPDIQTAPFVSSVSGIIKQSTVKKYTKYPHIRLYSPCIQKLLMHNEGFCLNAQNKIEVSAKHISNNNDMLLNDLSKNETMKATFKSHRKINSKINKTLVSTDKSLQKGKKFKKKNVKTQSKILKNKKNKLLKIKSDHISKNDNPDCASIQDKMNSKYLVENNLKSDKDDTMYGKQAVVVHDKNVEDQNSPVYNCTNKVRVADVQFAAIDEKLITDNSSSLTYTDNNICLSDEIDITNEKVSIDLGNHNGSNNVFKENNDNANKHIDCHEAIAKSKNSINQICGNVSSEGNLDVKQHIGSIDQINVESNSVSTHQSIAGIAHQQICLTEESITNQLCQAINQLKSQTNQDVQENKNTISHVDSEVEVNDRNNYDLNEIITESKENQMMNDEINDFKDNEPLKSCDKSPICTFDSAFKAKEENEMIDETKPSTFTENSGNEISKNIESTSSQKSDINIDLILKCETIKSYNFVDQIIENNASKLAIDIETKNPNNLKSEVNLYNHLDTVKKECKVETTSREINGLPVNDMTLKATPVEICDTNTLPDLNNISEKIESQESGSVATSISSNCERKQENSNEEIELKSKIIEKVGLTNRFNKVSVETQDKQDSLNSKMQITNNDIEIALKSQPHDYEEIQNNSELLTKNVNVKTLCNVDNVHVEDVENDLDSKAMIEETSTVSSSNSNGYEQVNTTETEYQDNVLDLASLNSNQQTPVVNETVLCEYNDTNYVLFDESNEENLCYPVVENVLDDIENETSAIPEPCMHDVPAKKIKRSFSDSALNSLKHKDNSDRQLLDNTPMWPPKRQKLFEFEHSEQVIDQNICNFIQQNRRNSVSSYYNTENVSFCILIDNDCILTDENEEEKICFTEVSEECIAESSLVENTLEEVTCCSQEPDINISDSAILDYDDEKSVHESSWLDDVACIETVVTDEVVEEDSKDCNTEESTEADKSFIHDEPGILNSELSEITNELLLTSKGLNSERHDVLKCERFHSYSPSCDENLLYALDQYKNENDLRTDEIPENTLRDPYNQESSPSSSEYSNSMFSPRGEKCLELPENKENIFESNETLNNTLNVESVDCTSQLNKTQCTIEHDDGTYFPESSLDNMTYSKEDDDVAYSPTSSSPEVSSTTSEEKCSSILLKITNYNGSRVSEINEINQNMPRCKFTESKEYSKSVGAFPKRPLITKAAQKYIPPIKESISDLKVKLPLPQQKLLKLKQLKLTKSEPKSTKPNRQPIMPIKVKPKLNFEDVLKSIDEVQMKMHKEKNKKLKTAVPKVVIKKSSNGSHYTSSSSREPFNPDLTGMKWQPWVFLEKNTFIDNMATKNKTKAIFSHRKNMYILAEKFKKYKSASNCSSEFVISQPKTSDLSKGQLKYTIRLKHVY